MSAGSLPMPVEDGLVRVTYLGLLNIESEELCPSCGIPYLEAIIGYSTSTMVLAIEVAGFCEMCDSMELGNAWEGDAEFGDF